MYLALLNVFGGKPKVPSEYTTMVTDVIFLPILLRNIIIFGCQPDVNDFGFKDISKHYVVGLDIAVDIPEGMKIFH
jgi:hypothetical protein